MQLYYSEAARWRRCTVTSSLRKLGHGRQKEARNLTASGYHPPWGVLFHGNKTWESSIRRKGAYIPGAPTTCQDGFRDASHVNNICHSSRTGCKPGHFLGSLICSLNNPAEQRRLFIFADEGLNLTKVGWGQRCMATEPNLKVIFKDFNCTFK